MDKPIHKMRPDKIVSLGICRVPEGRCIFTYLTLMENLDMGSFLRKDKDGIKKINAKNNTTIFLVEQNANLALKNSSPRICNGKRPYNPCGFR